jgi:hypothetical protein
MRPKILFVFIIIVVLYLVGYALFRQTHIQVWNKNGEPYVVFPKGNPVIYYFFRPLSYIDGAVTGMDFHIGPHEP